ncbi:MAG: hypothetical protein IIX30_01680 [Clostridia bacterium]|nr:hypothetical protein [Clostridia bacterium]
MADMQRITGMLGFAMRAGKLIFGTDLILSSLAKGKASFYKKPDDAPGYDD